MQKVPVALHRRRRTKAIASTKVGSDLAYQAALRGLAGLRSNSRWAARVIQENSPKSTGVVRAMARSRPLALSLHSQVGPYLLKGNLDLPAQHEPLDDLGRCDSRIGTQ